MTKSSGSTKSWSGALLSALNNSKPSTKNYEEKSPTVSVPKMN